MSANEISGNAPHPAPPPQQNTQAVEARLVRAEELQQKLEENSPRTTPPPSSSGVEEYKGDSIDVYA